MTEPEAAEYLGLRYSTLRLYRHERRGPACHSERVGRGWSHTYDRADLDAWVAERKARAVQRRVNDAKITHWPVPRGDRVAELTVDPRWRRLAEEYTAAKARVEERLELWRAVCVEPHVACVRLRAEAAALGSGLDSIERRLAVLLERLTPEAIDARAAAARALAQEREVSRWTAMMDRRRERQMGRTA